jgi:hypothetical protein
MTNLQEKAMRMALERLESHEYWMDERAIQALRQALAQPEQEFVGACVTCGAPKGEWLVDAVNISQERVDETATGEQEPVAWIKARELELMRGFIGTAQRDWRTNLGLEKGDDEDIPLYTAPPHYWGNVTSAELVEELRRRDMLMVPVKEQEPEWIDDGFGTMWQKCGKKDCGKFVVRVGKVACWNGDCPEKEPKREWVEITRGEISEIWGNSQQTIDEEKDAIAFGFAVEAKLKEKNGYE